MAGLFSALQAAAAGAMGEDMAQVGPRGGGTGWWGSGFAEAQLSICGLQAPAIATSRDMTWQESGSTSKALCA